MAMEISHVKQRKKNTIKRKKPLNSTAELKQKQFQFLYFLTLYICCTGHARVHTHTCIYYLYITTYFIEHNRHFFVYIFFC